MRILSVFKIGVSFLVVLAIGIFLSSSFNPDMTENKNTMSVIDVSDLECSGNARCILEP